MKDTGNIGQSGKRRGLRIPAYVWAVACILFAAILLVPCAVAGPASVAEARAAEGGLTVQADGGTVSRYFQKFTLTAPTGKTFAKGDVAVYVLKDGEIVSAVDATVQNGGTAAQVTTRLDAGFYTCVAKAPGCETVRREFTASNSAVSVEFAVQQPWDGFTTDRLWYDAAPESPAFYLRTPADFAALSDIVLEGEAFAGKRLVLLGDLDFGSNALYSVGIGGGLPQGYEGDSRPFEGAFEGGGHTISHYALMARDRQRSGIGLFGFVRAGSVAGLEVRDCWVKNLAMSDIAALVGCAQGASIDSCDVEATVSPQGSHGGIVCGSADAYSGAESIISNCISRGSLSVRTQSNSIGYGGVAGTISGSCVVLSCRNEADLSYFAAPLFGYSSCLGGIVGTLSSSTTATVDGCTNYGTITSNRTSVAGVIGAAFSTGVSGGHGATVTQCANWGDVVCTGTTHSGEGVAGIIGNCAMEKARILVAECWNCGNVRMSAPWGTSAAGIVGWFGSIRNYATVCDCYNTGSISAVGTREGRVAGIVGNPFGDVTIANCYSTGLLAAPNGFWGIACEVTGAPTILNCYYNKGTATSGSERLSDKEGRVQGRSVSEMRSAAFLKKLNVDDVFESDEKKANQGFPVLKKPEKERLTVASIKVVGSMSYTGKPAELPVRVFDASDRELALDKDYALEILDQQGNPHAFRGVFEVGTYTVIVRAKGNYIGVVTKLVSVTRAGLTEEMFTVVGTVPYTGIPQDPADLISSSLVNGRDYTVSMGASNSIDVGSHYLGVYGAGNYAGNLLFDYRVEYGMIGDVRCAPVSYCARAATPLLTVTNSANLAMRPQRDYLVRYLRDGNPIEADQVVDAGDYTVVVEGVGNYEGARFQRDFTVERARFSVSRIADIPYSGMPAEPSISAYLLDSATMLAPGDYNVSYEDADGAPIGADGIVEPGAYTAIVEGAGNYSGTVRCPFAVVRATFELDCPKNAPYAASSCVPDVTVWAAGANRDSDEPLARGRDYELDFARVETDGTCTWGILPSDMVEVGHYLVSAKGIGAHSGTLVVPFDIVPVALAFDGQIPALTFNADVNLPDVSAVGLVGDRRVPLAEGVDYELSYAYYGQAIEADDVVNTGDYDVFATGKGNYSGSSAHATFYIGPGIMSIDPIHAVVYNHSAQVPEAVVRVDGKVLSGEYYDITYGLAGSTVFKLEPWELRAAGFYSVRAVPKQHLASNFTCGTKGVTALYAIVKATASLSVSSLEYTGSPVHPHVVVKSGARTLDSSEYSVVYKSAKGRKVSSNELVSIGTYEAIVRPNDVGCYTEQEYTHTFNITKAVLQLDGLQKSYLLSDRKTVGDSLGLMVRRSNNSLLDESDYTLVFRNAKGKKVEPEALWDEAGGTYTVAIKPKGKSNYVIPDAQEFRIIGTEPEPAGDKQGSNGSDKGKDESGSGKDGSDSGQGGSDAGTGADSGTGSDGGSSDARPASIGSGTESGASAGRFSQVAVKPNATAAGQSSSDAKKTDDKGDSAGKDGSTKSGKDADAKTAGKTADGKAQAATDDEISARYNAEGMLAEASEAWEGAPLGARVAAVSLVPSAVAGLLLFLLYKRRRKERDELDGLMDGLSEDGETR